MMTKLTAVAAGSRDDGVKRGSDGHEGGPDRIYAVVTGAAYGALFVLGVGVGGYGSFYYSVPLGPVPIGLFLAIAATYVTCWLGGRGMKTKSGAAVPALGWFVAVLTFSQNRVEGDFLLTGQLVSYGFLFGGALAAVLAVSLSQSRPTVHS